MLFFQVDTNFEQVAETRFVSTLHDVEKVNHIVVFLTGTTPFPDGFGGAGLFYY